jgi:hypothetical protein
MIILFTLLVKVSLILNTHVSYLPDVLKETRKRYKSLMKWWDDAKFGMFITQGVSSVPGKGDDFVESANADRGI